MSRYNESRVRELYAAGNYSSGVGSTMDATAEVRAQLPAICAEFGIKTLLDCPCGDMAWMRQVNLAGVAYTGADIMEELVRRHLRAFPGRMFFGFNAITDALPRAYDLILCRDFLFHISNADIERVLANFRASGSRYLLTTTWDLPGRTPDLAGPQAEIGWGFRRIAVCDFGLAAAVASFRESAPVCRGRWMELHEINPSERSQP